MITGHFGLAVGVKAGAPRLPLWALFVASYLLDLVSIGLIAAGVESITPMNPGHPAYGQFIIHAYYSHSLVGAIVLAGIATLIALPLWGKRNSLVVGAVVISHWILDLIVHRHDLPILPGNAGNLPMFGFGLWNYPVASGIVELAICAVGMYLYVRSAQKTTDPGSAANRQGRGRIVLSAAVTSALLMLLAFSDFLSINIVLDILIILLLIVLSGWLDSRIAWRDPAEPSARVTTG